MSTLFQDTRLSEPNPQVVSAIRRAIRSMQLVDGLEIHFNELTGHLSFGYEIEQLNAALTLIGADQEEPVVQRESTASVMAARPSDTPQPTSQRLVLPKWLSRLVRS